MRVSVRPQITERTQADAVLVPQPAQRVGPSLVGPPGPLQPVPCVAPAPAQITQSSILHSNTSAVQPPVLRSSTAAPAGAVISSRPASSCVGTAQAASDSLFHSPRGTTTTAAEPTASPLAVRRACVSSTSGVRGAAAGASAAAQTAKAVKAAVPLRARGLEPPVTRCSGAPQSARTQGAEEPPVQAAQDQDVRDEHGDRGEGSAEALAALQAAKGIDDRTLVVFDFDRTIMKEHMWKKYRETDIAEIRITDDHFVDLHKFRALVFSIRMKGHNVAVATFGRRDVVDKALHYALGNPHEVSIRTPADFGQREGSGILGNKNTHLANLAERFQVSARKIILVDDDKHNIEAAAQAGVQGHWVPDGLGEPMVEQIARQVGVQPMDAWRAAEFMAEAENKGPRSQRAMGRRDTGPPTQVLARLKKLVDEGIEDEAECSSASSDEPGVSHKPSARLQSAFAAYSLGQHQMDSKNFAKLCSDCNLLDEKLTDADIIANVTGKRGGGMSFEDFEAALALIANQRGIRTEVVSDVICGQGRVKRVVPQDPAPAASSQQREKAQPPSQVRRESGQVGQATATKPRRTSTGLARPAANPGAQQDVSRGLASSRNSPRGSTQAPQPLTSPRATSPRAASPGTPASQSLASTSRLEEVFKTLASPTSRGGTQQLELRAFTKFCKDGGLLDRKLTTTDVELIVAKVVGPKGARKLSFQDFDRALGLVAEKKGSTDALKRALHVEPQVEMAPAA